MLFVFLHRGRGPWTFQNQEKKEGGAIHLGFDGRRYHYPRENAGTEVARC